jgi:hypothetical protein
LNKESLGIPALAMGVPLVTYAGNIARDYMKKYGKTIVNEKDGYYQDNNRLHDLVVTPKEINVLVEKCSDILASAINRLRES